MENEVFTGISDIQLSCKHQIRPCLLISAMYLKQCIRKNAFTDQHPACRGFESVWNNLHDGEMNLLDVIDGEPIFHILGSVWDK